MRAARQCVFNTSSSGSFNFKDDFDRWGPGLFTWGVDNGFLISPQIFNPDLRAGKIRDPGYVAIHLSLSETIPLVSSP
jgi:hypothetical protein